MNLSAALTHIGGDRELLTELLEIFLEDCPLRMQALKDAAAAADSRRLGDAAHTLKGALRVLGATGAADRALELETLGRSGRCDGAAELIGALEPEIDQLLEFIGAELAKSRVPSAGPAR